MTNRPRPRFVKSAAEATLESQPSLLDCVSAALRRLAPHGWSELLARHGLDIGAEDLGAELSRPLGGIDRKARGFEDFASEGRFGIEPGSPARSLLFHAFAAPRVTTYLSHGREIELSAFPTLAEIEAVENYVYGVDPPSIDSLRAKAGGARLAIVVFALEYRPARGTVHQRHADMVYSRTGVARVGTSDAHYLPYARGYLPFVEGDSTQLRTLPCRYAPFIAALVPGRKGSHGPARFIEPGAKTETVGSPRRNAGLREAPMALRGAEPGDARRQFWVPLHKLFSGRQCIRGKEVEVRLAATHVNEKIRRAHLKFLSAGHNAGWLEPDISQPPFIFQDGIAEFSTAASDGGWLLCPTPHPRLVDPALYNGAPLTYRVPPTPEGDGPWRAYSSSLNLIAQPSGARAAPEYLHARHRLDPDGVEQDLNDEPNVADLVKAGGYWARHYVDHTGDGWIDVECSELALALPQRLPAYSIVSTPHFFPFVNQTALMDWTDQSMLPSLMPLLWDAPGSGLPQALSDQRYAANLQLADANFDPTDDTMTAIIGPFGSGDSPFTASMSARHRRVSMLPDSAAGVFAPGWDVSYDRTSETDPEDTGKNLAPGTTFLTNYGLGSPFVEDSKLCAALSSFWPAAAPDITRTFSPSRNYATATPLTDEVIGLGASRPWDGVTGPRVREVDHVVEYPSLDYADYVRTALDRGFDIAVIARTSVEDYLARTLTMGLVYRALGVEKHDDKLKWSVLSFRPAEATDGDLKAAQAATGRQLNRHFTYRYLVFDHADRGATDPADFKKVLVKYGDLTLLFADPTLVLLRNAHGEWTASEVRR